jgi:hypothetical protein
LNRAAQEQGSADEPMPFAIDLLAGIEILLAIGAGAFLGLAHLARQVDDTYLPALEEIYPRFLREPGPTALVLLAGPPILVAIGLFLRKPWGRWSAMLLHGALGICALWYLAARFLPRPEEAFRSADLTIVMFFVLAQSIGVPLFLRRRHMLAAFARGRR